MSDKTSDASRISEAVQAAIAISLVAVFTFIAGVGLGTIWDASSVKTKTRKEAIAAGCAGYRTDADGEPEFYFIQEPPVLDER